MYLVFFAMGLAALGVALGFLYRASAILFFLTYTYVFLLDKTHYNNHYYLISLLGFLLIFVDAHRWASVDQKLRPDLQAEQERLARRAGLAPEPRKFTPHITLAWLRREATPEAVAMYLAQGPVFTPLTFTADRVTVYSARESTGGGPYIAEAEFPFA